MAEDPMLHPKRLAMKRTTYSSHSSHVRFNIPTAAGASQWLGQIHPSGADRVTGVLACYFRSMSRTEYSESTQSIQVDICVCVCVSIGQCVTNGSC